MTDFNYSNIGEPTSLVKQLEHVQPTDVEFVEKWKWEGGPIFYCCGESNEVGWWECPRHQTNVFEDSGHGRLG